MQNFKILTLNCQKGYQPSFRAFFQKILSESQYDFIILQEANEAVLSIFRECQSSYLALNPFDSNLGEKTNICLLYRNIFSLKESSLTSFANFNNKFSRGWGLLVGVFEYMNDRIVVGSVHLHSGIKTSIRLKELEIVKGQLLKYRNNGCPIVFGGDFNTGFPGEVASTENLLSPEFIRASKTIGATLNSRYTETAPFLLNRISVILARLGLGFNFRTDHFYIDSATLKTWRCQCQKLLDRVSDHSPVVLIISHPTKL
jgi:endonuclease/exonuclease/phosphatase family metal-dependent hydrolase